MVTNYKQGFFKPRFPKKYLGDPTNIVYRSGWERRVMQYLDEKSSVTAWSSEEVVIPYISPVDNRRHRYFVDFYVEITDENKNVRKMLLEVKPAAQAQEPKKQTRKTKRYITEVMTWGVNQAKWKAAEEFCLDRGWEFKLITEKELFRKNSK